MSEIDPRSRLEQLRVKWRARLLRTLRSAELAEGSGETSADEYAAEAAAWQLAIDDIDALLASLPEGEETGWRDELAWAVDQIEALAVRSSDGAYYQRGAGREMVGMGAHIDKIRRLLADRTMRDPQ